MLMCMFQDSTVVTQPCEDGGAGPALGNDPENWRAEATGAESPRETGVYPGSELQDGGR